MADSCTVNPQRKAHCKPPAALPARLGQLTSWNDLRIAGLHCKRHCCLLPDDLLE